MIKSLTPLILITFAIWKKMKRSSYSKPQLWNPFSPTSHLVTHRVLILIERKVLSHLLNPKWLGRGKVPFFEGTPGNRSSGDGVGPVAQRIRARGYEPRCRGFESLLAHNRPKKGRIFPSGGRKIMIGIADPKLCNLGVGLLSKWSSLTFSFFFLFTIHGFFK